MQCPGPSTLPAQKPRVRDSLFASSSRREGLFHSVRLTKASHPLLRMPTSMSRETADIRTLISPVHLGREGFGLHLEGSSGCGIGPLGMFLMDCRLLYPSLEYFNFEVYIIPVFIGDLS